MLKPKDNAKDAIYHFTVTAKVRFGRASKVSTPYTLAVGCSRLMQWVDNPEFVFNLHVNPGNPENRHYEVKFPKTISLQGCPVYEYEIKNQTLNGEPLTKALVARQANCSYDPYNCIFIKPLHLKQKSLI